MICGSKCVSGSLSGSMLWCRHHDVDRAGQPGLQNSQSSLILLTLVTFTASLHSPWRACRPQHPLRMERAQWKLINNKKI